MHLPIGSLRRFVLGATLVLLPLGSPATVGAQAAVADSSPSST